MSRRLTTVAGQCGKPARRLRTRLELSIDGSERASPIRRRHSCAWAAVSDSHARSCGSSSRPSGVTSRPALNEKPAQGPVRFRSRTIRLHARVGAGADARSTPASHGTENIIYIMRNAVSVRRWLCRLRMAMAEALAWLLPPCWLPPTRMSLLTATTETPQIPQLSARISPQGRPRFPDLPQRCP